MADRRRKRQSANHFADDTVKDFNAVDSIQVRRQSSRSDYSDHERGFRNESWMSKASLAMSSRIFSGGKKLNSSRSTQVLPFGAGQSDNSMTSMQETEESSTSFSGQPSLRLVASEKVLGSSTEPSRTSSPLSTFDPCPSVTCDVAPDASAGSLHDDEEKTRWPSNGSAHRHGDSQWRSNGRRQHSSTIVQKVRPGDEDQKDDNEVEMMTRSTRTRITSIPTGMLRPRDTSEDADAEIYVQDAAPILKGFFSKSVTVSKEQRQQQSEQRRQTLYQESKKRQDKLRVQTERERVASEEANHKRKVEQLRRFNQQRRMELLRNAASARKNLLERVQEDNDVYQSEREWWEDHFEDEMRVLSAAFRKARTSDENRPMTVAGLAVPEAISQLERDATSFEKRVKTAQPALASMTLRQQATERPSTSGTTPSNINEDLSSSLFFDSCEVLALEDSKDVFDWFGNDEQVSSDFFSPKSCNVLVDHKDQGVGINQLLGEREQLLQRLAAIDRMVQSQQQ